MDQGAESFINLKVLRSDLKPRKKKDHSGLLKPLLLIDFIREKIEIFLENESKIKIGKFFCKKKTKLPSPKRLQAKKRKDFKSSEEKISIKNFGSNSTTFTLVDKKLWRRVFIS